MGLHFELFAAVLGLACGAFSIPATPQVAAASVPPVLSPETSYFISWIQLCDDAANCATRKYGLPVDEWAANCDTLGGAQVGLEGLNVSTFWSWIESGTTQLPENVDLIMYEDTYCGGKPVMADTPWYGAYTATQDATAGDKGWAFPVQHTVRSVRVTAVGQLVDRGDMIGVKLVLWPLYNENLQLGFLDEFDCVSQDGGYYDVGLPVADPADLVSTWPSACASPIDRVYCIERSVDEWGAVDDWPTYGFDFADNWDITKPFQGVYPMGSALSNRYYSSWTSEPPCRNYETQDPLVDLPTGSCIVTKLYTDPCTTVATSLDQWTAVTPQIVLNSMGHCTNADGTSCVLDKQTESNGTWPLPIRCAWTRVVTSECGGVSVV